VLDVGCGLGQDAAAIARRVVPGGRVVGIDSSQAMIEQARDRHRAIEGLSFEVADAVSLPFADASFDACRIDRVLQHIEQPVPVVRELARVLRPGGGLVAYDNDWETLTVDDPDRALTRTILNAWCDRFPSGWIGRQLVPLFLDAGLGDVEALPRTLVLRDLDTADRLYAFFATADRLSAAGGLDPAAAAAWCDRLRAAAARGRFFTAYNGVLVHGTLAQPAATR
jgi:SAM-dependent methyltransferase